MWVKSLLGAPNKFLKVNEGNTKQGLNLGYLLRSQSINDLFKSKITKLQYFTWKTFFCDMSSWSASKGNTPWTQYQGNFWCVGYLVSISVKHWIINFLIDSDTSLQLYIINWKRKFYIMHCFDWPFIYFFKLFFRMRKNICERQKGI